MYQYALFQLIVSPQFCIPKVSLVQNISRQFHVLLWFYRFRRFCCENNAITTQTTAQTTSSTGSKSDRQFLCRGRMTHS